VRVVPEKTRIAFQVRMSFAAVSLRRDRIVGHVVLARRLQNPRFTKIEYIWPRNHVHFFCFYSREELDRECWPGSSRLTVLASNAFVEVSKEQQPCHARSVPLPEEMCVRVEPLHPAKAGTKQKR